MLASSNERLEMLTRFDLGCDGFFLISEGLYKHLVLRLPEMLRGSWAVGRILTDEMFILRGLL